MIFAVTAVILVWSLIAHDLWVLSGSAMSGDDLGGGPGGHRPRQARLLVLLLGMFLSCLVWQAWRQLQQAGHESAAHVALQRLIVDHASEAMMLTDSAQRIVSVNAAFTAITGYREEEVLGKTPTRLSPDHHGLSGHRAIWDFVAENAGWEGEIWDRRKDGTFTRNRCASPPFARTAQVSHYVAVFTDISESKAQAQRLDYLARHDPLTNLPNRLALDADLVAAINTAVPGIDRMALLIIDLDNFKTINDSLGHAAGDRLLSELARRLGAQMDQSRRLYRLGGDEVRGLHRRPAGRGRRHRIGESPDPRIGESVDLDGHVLHTTPSIGISLYPEDGRDAQALIRNADTAMYHAKANGRANYKFFTEPMNAAATKRLHLESELGALADNQLVLHYQPRSTCSAARWSASKHLVRWRHPQRGLVGPAEFIPVAEECGLIPPLGHWVLLTACRQVKAWLDQGIDMGEMAVNISPTSSASRNSSSRCAPFSPRQGCWPAAWSWKSPKAPSCTGSTRPSRP